jgi:hypothetical protein
MPTVYITQKAAKRGRAITNYGAAALGRLCY